MNIEEITSIFSYTFSDLFKIRNLANLSYEEIESTFREHDDVVRIEDTDDSPIICSKYFDNYYVFADGKPDLEKKSIMIMNATKIPLKFLDKLSSKDFVNIIGSFHEEVSEGFIWKEKIKDSQNPKKVIAQVAMGSMIFDKKYLDFLKKYQ